MTDQPEYSSDTPPPTISLRRGDLGSTGTLFRKRFEIPFADELLTIGRSSTNQIELPHSQVSQLHALLRQAQGKHFILDQGSTNGTFVNGLPVRSDSQKALQHEDLIQIGPFLLQFDANDARIHVYDIEQGTELRAVNLSKKIGDKVILSDIGFEIHPGEFVGLLGPSGSGKSSLLGALNGFRPAHSGKVTINQFDLYENFASLKKGIGYVPQDDIIHQELTVQRTLHYISMVRLPVDTSAQERFQRIDQVIHTLGLDNQRHVPVHRLSGGQRKRVSIGVELMTEPSLIFLDEPTSGLDPALEERMMHFFQDLSRQGKTILLTTHIMENIDLFDKVLVVVEGHLAYFGPPKKLREHFDIGDIRDLYTRLAEHPAQEWGQRYASTSDHQDFLKRPILEKREIDPSILAQKISWKHRLPQIGILEGFRQWFILSIRYLEIFLKDYRNTGILLAQAPLIALLIFLAEPTENFVLFISSLVALWFGCSNAAPQIVKEKSIYTRERMVNLGIIPYVASKITVLSLLGLVQCSILLLFLNLLRPLGLSGDLTLLFIPLFLSNGVGLLTGLLISASVDTTDKATALVPLVLIPQILFAGLFGPLAGWKQYIGYVAPTFWSYDAVKRISVEQPEHPESLIPATHRLEIQSRLQTLESESATLGTEIEQSLQELQAILKQKESEGLALRTLYREPFESLGKGSTQQASQLRELLSDTKKFDRTKLEKIRSLATALDSTLNERSRIDGALLEREGPATKALLDVKRREAEIRKRLDRARNNLTEIQKRQNTLYENLDRYVHLDPRVQLWMSLLILCGYLIVLTGAILVVHDVQDVWKYQWLDQEKWLEWARQSLDRYSNFAQTAWRKETDSQV
ncbi:MAG: ATP-binding cassette domain-containing protein [Planctomycetota bacterium]|nr:ATP-binding cassette domain-containing protein [Planctomycetota bacterium]